MMDVQTAFETWNAANAALAQLYEETLGNDDTADNLARWLEELNAIRDRLDTSSKILAAHCPAESRTEFVSIVDQLLANIEQSRSDMRAQISRMN